MLDNSSKIKSRPKDNFHCFMGTGRAFWRSVATGRGEPELKNSPDGYYFAPKEDLDGCAVQNGGIQAPREEILPDRAVYFRFYSTHAANRYGRSAWVGNWWLADSGFQHLASIARTTGQPLQRVAQNYLAIPAEWSDCGYIVKAVLNVKLKAWVGHGRAAHGAISPDSDLRSKGDGGLYWMPGCISPPQLFIPGAREPIAGFFTPISQGRSATFGGHS
ncbi:MAG: hypothetical protein AB8B85_12680 [Paracoccaceae bacterium]